MDHVSVMCKGIVTYLLVPAIPKKVHKSLITPKKKYRQISVQSAESEIPR